MGSLSENVTLTIRLDSSGIERDGFGTYLILSSSAGAIFDGTERTRTYEDLAGMEDDGFGIDGPEYLAASAVFSQDPHPSSIKIGKCALPSTQKYKIAIASAAVSTDYVVQVDGEGVTSTEVTATSGGGDYTFTVNTGDDKLTLSADLDPFTSQPVRVSNSGGALPTGLAADTDYWPIQFDTNVVKLASSRANAIALTGIDITTAGTGTHTLHTATNDVICARLKQALNDVVGKNYLATQVAGAGETDYVEVTANQGDWFSLEVLDTSLLTVSQTHADPGVATDLSAIELYDDDWYSLDTSALGNSNAIVLAAAAWVEARAKIYTPGLSDSGVINLAVLGSDTADDLHTLDYSRTGAIYHPSPRRQVSAAWNGVVLTIDPGGETWKWKSLDGVPATTLTATQRANLRAKKCNFYAPIAGQGSTFDGTTADGNFIDVARGLDWLDDDMSKAVLEVLLGNPKVPYTNAGIAQIEAAVRASLKRAEENGIIDAGWTVTVPKVANVSAANKAIRRLPSVKFTATLAGAVHTVAITGTVTE